MKNNILENMCRRKFGTAELKILKLIADGAQSHSIENISFATGICKPNVSRTIKRLMNDKVLIEKRPPYSHEPRVLAINEKFSEWENHERVI